MNLLPQDVDRATAALPPCVLHALQSNPGDLVLAGGFFASVLGGSPVADIDLWARNGDVAEKVANALPGVHTSHSDAAYTIRVPEGELVQVIYGFPFESPGEVISGFDFYVCRASLWFSADPVLRMKTLCSESFYRDLYGKRARYAKEEITRSRVPSVYRAIKYALKGYSVSIEDVAHMAFDSCKEKATPEDVLAGMTHPSAVDEAPAPDPILDCPF